MPLALSGGLVFDKSAVFNPDRGFIISSSIETTSVECDATSFWPRLKARLARLKSVFTILVTLLVLALAWTAASHLAGEVSYQDLRLALHATPWWKLGAALCFTIVSFMALVVYDWEALAYIGKKLPLPVVALTSFCAYAVGNTAGFGPLTGGAIRYRFYTPFGVEAEDVARIIAFVTLAFGLGLVGVSGFGLSAASEDMGALPFPPIIASIIGILIIAASIGLCLGAGKDGRQFRLFSMDVRLPSRGIVIRQFAATAVDVCAAASVLWILLPAGSGVSLASFIAIYAVAIALGVLSHVPGGLGVFETVIIAALGSYLPIDSILGALVLYRVIYYLAPLATAAMAITILEGRRAAATPAVAAIVRVGASLTPPVLSAFTLVIAAVLIFSSVTPIGDETLLTMANWLPLSLVEGSHFLGSVLGVVLLLVARGLAYRLDGAWWVAVTVTFLSIVLALLKAAAWDEAVLLLLLLAALLASRREFSRRASLLHQALTVNWMLAVSALLMTALALLFFVYKDVSYNNDLWWQFEFSEQAPRSLRALMGIALTAGFGAMWMLLRPVRVHFTPPAKDEMDIALDIVARQDRTEALLAAMGDKSFLFSDDKTAFIMYARKRRSWVALGDPVGPLEHWPELIWRFVETARGAGGRAVFYQVGAESLSLYADAGLRAFKLGEEARVLLETFDLKGSKRANMRTALNKAEREGVEFAFIGPEDIDPIMPELRLVSDGWLDKHKVREKRFSLGAFNEDYVRRQSVGVLRLNGKIVAFASLMLTDLKEEASIDLMRFSHEAPPGSMDVLMVRLALYFKEQGYKWFVLGMAPLSGLPDRKAAPMWSRVGRLVFDHGERLYNFSGLRAFKSKFSPEWRPRYMAISGRSTPMMALADVTILISGGLKGVIGK